MARTPSFLLDCLQTLHLKKPAPGVRLRFILSCTVLTWCTSVIPSGRFGTLRKDIEASGKAKSEGGNGRGEEFWEWSEKQVQRYL